MSMLVARMEKRNTQNLGGMQKHNQREFENHSNKEIDKSRSHLNYELVNDTQINYREKIMGIIESQRTSTRAIRKDAVLVNEWIITSDQEFFKDMPLEDCQDFFKHTVDWFKSRYSEQNIAFASVHLDETTPHMHLGVVPMRDGRLQSKNVFNRKELLAIQAELPKYLQEKSFDIKRGVEGSKAKHLTVPEYKEMQKDLRKLEEQKDKMLSEAIELAVRGEESAENTKVLESKNKLLNSEYERLRSDVRGMEKNYQKIECETAALEMKYKFEKRIFEGIRHGRVKMSDVEVIQQMKGIPKKPTGKVEIDAREWREVKDLAVTGEAFREQSEAIQAENYRLQKENERLEKEKERLKAEKNAEMNKRVSQGLDLVDLQKENRELKAENRKLNQYIDVFNKFIEKFNLIDKIKEFASNLRKEREEKKQRDLERQREKQRQNEKGLKR